MPRLLRFALATSLLLVTAGCPSSPSDTVSVAPGVTFRRDVKAGVQVLDVDLRTAKVRPVVVAASTEKIRNNIVGDCKTVAEWADEANAVGGINGGFFGDTYDQVGRRKQIVGLCAVDGKVIAPWSVLTSTRGSRERYVRSAVGFADDGMPQIGWATGSRQGGLKRYEAAVNPLQAEDWDVRFAVGCGPRLFASGRRQVTDHDERLVSAGKLSRAFVAFDTDPADRPRHFLLGRADGMEYADVADWLAAHFKRTHQSKPAEAMCLDGGPSAQLVYRANGRLEDAEATGVLVPTAILLVPK